MNPSKAQEILDLAKEMGVIRPKDLAAYGIQRSYLQRLCQQGHLVRCGRGLYMLPDADLTEHHSLAEACKRAPQGIVCLLSALRFHDLTTQAPFEVWLAIEQKAHRPVLEIPPLRIFHFSGPAFESGVEEHLIEGIPVRVYNPAKTVVDCFKFRNKIGLDVALEALRECWRARRCTMDEIWEYAKVCRVTNVMRPYLESIV